MNVDRDEIGCVVQAGSGNRLIDCPTDEVRALLRDHGYVQFVDFAATPEEFEEFSNRFGRCANTRTVHYPEGGEALGFHAEDAYNPYRPDSLWFLCVFEGSDGGAPTGVVDGVELLTGLPDEWRRFCLGNTLRFDRQWSAELWREAVGADAKDELDAVLSGIPGITHHFLADDDLFVSYETPIVTRTPAGADSFSNTMLQAITEPPFYGMSLGTGDPVPAELADMVETMALERERYVGWSAGQVAVIDNLRMMHRRAEYSGVDRDLRARHCEDLFGSVLPGASTPVAAWAKSLLQGDEGYPSKVGPLSSSASRPARSSIP